MSDSIFSNAATTPFEQAFSEIGKLCENFRNFESRYLDAGYQEAQTRKDFIDPFFIALGWDVNNQRQPNPFLREVRLEHGVQTRQGKKKADYAFFIAPEFTRERFFVEAKKPSESLVTPDHYFQAIRYGWTKGHSLVVLTNFYETHILDCRGKPNIETAIQKSLLRLSYRDYSDREKFKELYYLLSRDEVANNAFDKFILSQKPKSGKQLKLLRDASQALDNAFLSDLDHYREELAKAFKKDNPELEGLTLTEVTQRSLDRLVFIRFLEDKLILSEPIMEKFSVSGKPWETFQNACKQLDAHYNGIVFKTLPALDEMRVDSSEAVFSNICDELSGQYSPYDFSQIPIYILGSIYERFLGKVIRTTAKQVRVEEKDEVRKAGGVYYTPEYIVRYIVRQTVGAQIKGKTPEQISALSFADIACGSGSFLLGVFDELLHYHRTWFNAHPAQAKKYRCSLDSNGVYQLPLYFKRQILLANIYGVDIDTQAVEVAQLSLYLKLLEEETTHSAYQFGIDHHEPLLPSLSKNIVCGNSLVSRDIYDTDLFADASNSEQRKLNAMDFEDAFPKVMRSGGFDAIVGNPPYGRLQNSHALAHVSQYANKFSAMPDMYVAFMWQALRLLLPSGKLAYITPSAWLGGPAYLPLREMILNASLEFIVSLPFDVFADAYIDTAIFVLSNTKAHTRKNVLCYSYNKKAKIETIEDEDLTYSKVPLSAWKNTEDKKITLSAQSATLVSKLQSNIATKLGDFVDIKRGVLFDKDLLTRKRAGKNSYPYFEGDVYRYELNFSAPHFVEYGAKMKEYPKEFKWFEGERILLRRLVNRQQRLMAVLIDSTCITNKNLYSLLPKSNGEDSPDLSLEFLLSVLNSRLISKLYLMQVQQATKDDFPQVTIKDIAALACPVPSTAQQTQMSKYVKRMLHTRTLLAKSITESDTNFYTRECRALDRQIDTLIYSLYGLSEQEIALIEEELPV